MRPPDRSSAKINPFGSDRHRVHAAELSGALAVAAELTEIVHRRVENHDAVIVEAVGDQDASVRQERHVLWLREMRGIAAGHVLLAERLQQCLAVVREYVDGVERLVDHPHAARRIVWADAQAMRSWSGGAFAEVVPLRPALLHVAVAIERVEAVLPHAAIGQGQHVHLDRAGEPANSGGIGVGRRNSPRCATKMRSGLLGEHAGVAAERKPRRGKRLVPCTHHVVGTGSDRSLGDRVCASPEAPTVPIASAIVASVRIMLYMCDYLTMRSERLEHCLTA